MPNAAKSFSAPSVVARFVCTPSSMAVAQCRQGIGQADDGKGWFRGAVLHTSNNAGVRPQGDVVGLTHDVATPLRMQGEQDFSQERETLVSCTKQQGLWLACHNHLSAMPEGLPPP